MKNIEKAKSVEAMTYAPDDFDSAVSEYDSGEELIVEEGKSTQNDKARVKYLEADKLAQSAYGKSIGPYIGSFIQRTEEEIEKARVIKVDVARPEAFESAVAENEQAQDAFNNNDYEQAKSASLSAYDQIRQAYAETLELRNQAELLDQEYLAVLNELQDQKAEAAVPDEYEEATADYEDVHAQFEEGYYEEVLLLYDEGILNAIDLQALIEEKRLLALEALENAEASIEEAKMKAQEVESEM